MEPTETRARPVDEQPVEPGRAPDGVDSRSRPAYEAGMRDRAKILGHSIDPAEVAATGSSEGANGVGGGGIPKEIPPELRDKPGR